MESDNNQYLENMKFRFIVSTLFLSAGLLMVLVVLGLFLYISMNSGGGDGGFGLIGPAIFIYSIGTIGIIITSIFSLIQTYYYFKIKKLSGNGYWSFPKIIMVMGVFFTVLFCFFGSFYTYKDYKNKEEIRSLSELFSKSYSEALNSPLFIKIYNDVTNKLNSPQIVTKAYIGCMGIRVYSCDLYIMTNKNIAISSMLYNEYDYENNIEQMRDMVNIVNTKYVGREVKITLLSKENFFEEYKYLFNHYGEKLWMKLSDEEFSLLRIPVIFYIDDKLIDYKFLTEITLKPYVSLSNPRSKLPLNQLDPENYDDSVIVLEKQQKIVSIQVLDDPNYGICDAYVNTNTIGTNYRLSFKLKQKVCSPKLMEFKDVLVGKMVRIIPPAEDQFFFEKKWANANFSEIYLNMFQIPVDIFVDGQLLDQNYK